ncbi:MAG: class II aldolase/adducin family protein [Phycisphaerae bacterium]|nr:class II aldolase/adducin family protein [Phycisphaerae bacterium]
MDSEWHIRREIVEFGKRVYEKGFVAASDGNISHRLTGDRVLITPTGFCLGELKPAELTIVDTAGRFLTGPHKPTSELPLHLTVYHMRPDVQAIVHAHPPIANAFSFAGESLEQCVIPEVVVGFGTIPTTPYATPSCKEGAEVIKDLIGDHDGLLLQRHGSLTVGKDLREAYFKLEKIEHAAHITLLARMLGKVIPLSDDELRRLGKVSERNGWRSADTIWETCKNVGRVPPAADRQPG